MKRTFSFFILLFSLVAIAQEECEDRRLETVPSELEQLYRYVSWNSASAEQISNAPAKQELYRDFPSYSV